jgi:predicted RNA-binding Zn-ribbon protein involved in translation (DUF1610 family)
VSRNVEYERDTDVACLVASCGAPMHSDRRWIYFRCATCGATYTRLGLRYIADAPDEPPSIPRAVIIDRDDD